MVRLSFNLINSNLEHLVKTDTDAFFHLRRCCHAAQITTYAWIFALLSDPVQIFPVTDPVRMDLPTTLKTYSHLAHVLNKLGRRQAAREYAVAVMRQHAKMLFVSASEAESWRKDMGDLHPHHLLDLLAVRVLERTKTPDIGRLKADQRPRP
jgi:hypothetical protein